MWNFFLFFFVEHKESRKKNEKLKLRERKKLEQNRIYRVDLKTSIGSEHFVFFCVMMMMMKLNSSPVDVKSHNFKQMLHLKFIQQV
jgi:hypothetical protein